MGRERVIEEGRGWGIHLARHELLDCSRAPLCILGCAIPRDREPRAIGFGHYQPDMTVPDGSQRLLP